MDAWSAGRLLAAKMASLATAANTLMVLSLLERQVRQRLDGEPMYGLYPENRPSKAPTGIRLIAAFEYLCVIVMTEGPQTTRHLGELDATQRQILALLDIPPDQLATCKRRCGI